ncbi:MAG TPA: Rieske (2Fe-2S) protein [Caulobacteraceae bacterium]
MGWTDVIGLDCLEARGRAVVRHDGRQILVMRTDKGVFACANRCPHQGYPLSEGVLSDGCVLTCNWHNWKFDLADGRTLVGGDRLRRFPARVEAGRVLLDLTAEDPRERRERVLAGLHRALEDGDQERLVRETARLIALGADGAEAVSEAVEWAAGRLEFGTTHALAAAPDWLTLHDSHRGRADERLAALGEILGHIADDARGRQTLIPSPTLEAPWSEPAFLAAIEAEDEIGAVAALRGAVRAGIAVGDLLPSLLRAALAHYADFGHSLIYAVKTAALARRLGPATAETLLSLLARSLVYARREDLLPEFRDYRARLEAWGRPAAGSPPLTALALRNLSAKSAMAVVGKWSASHPPEAIFEVLLEASAWTLLHVDADRLVSTKNKIADNVGWLDFTHALTFADAGRMAVRVAPELWPAVLLQLACFVGRNAAYLDPVLDVSPFMVGDADAFLAVATARLFDHGQAGFIISAHLIKTLMAAKALAAASPRNAPILFSAANRFLAAPIKRRHVLRTARQMRAFVAQE